MDDLLNQIQTIEEKKRDINNRISAVIANETKELERLKERDAELREKLLEAMEQNGVKKFENKVLRITYVPAQIRTSVDTTRLKAEAPELYDEFSKETKVKASLRINVYESEE